MSTELRHNYSLIMGQSPNEFCKLSKTLTSKVRTIIIFDHQFPLVLRKSPAGRQGGMWWVNCFLHSAAVQSPRAKRTTTAVALANALVEVEVVAALHRLHVPRPQARATTQPTLQRGKSTGWPKQSNFSF